MNQNENDVLNQVQNVSENPLKPINQENNTPQVDDLSVNIPSKHLETNDFTVNTGINQPNLNTYQQNSKETPKKLIEPPWYIKITDDSSNESLSNVHNTSASFNPKTPDDTDIPVGNINTQQQNSRETPKKLIEPPWYIKITDDSSSESFSSSTNNAQCISANNTSDEQEIMMMSKQSTQNYENYQPSTTNATQALNSVNTIQENNQPYYTNQQSQYGSPVQTSYPPPNPQVIYDTTSYNSFEWFYPPVSLTYETMQQLQTKAEAIKLDLFKQGSLNQLTVNKQRMLNEEKLRSLKEMDNYKQSYESKLMSCKDINQHFTNSQGELDCNLIVANFLQLKAIVKVKLQNIQWLIMWLSEDDNRHVSIEHQNLLNELEQYIEDEVAITTSISQAIIRKCQQKLLHKIPKLEKSNLIILEPHQVMFRNGFWDLKTREFHPISNKQRPNYFTMYSLDVNYISPINLKTPVYDKLLCDALDNNLDAIDLYWQQVGAILTPVPMLKKIFLYQGAPNGGKTRLANILIRCMPYEDTLILSNLSEISKDRLITGPIRLLVVQELGKNKIPAKQITKLKSFADGSNLPGSLSLKILMSTNYSIRTGENDVIEPALKNRLSVLPFPKAMTNSDPEVACFEDVFFETEKQAIILKALNAFSVVLHNNNQFKIIFEPNQWIYTENAHMPTSFDFEHMANTATDMFNNDYNSTLTYVIENLFETVNHINPVMTTTNIKQILEESFPDCAKNESGIGRLLKSIFGEHLKNSRINGTTCYNLAIKNYPLNSPR